MEATRNHRTPRTYATAVPDDVRQALRFLRGLWDLTRHPTDPRDHLATVTGEFAERGARFVSALDALVWNIPSSPYRPLLAHAGIERADVAALVGERGLEGTLRVLRDAGVYVAYEELQGLEPARRGSATFHFTPGDFANPRHRPDFIGSTGGTRSGGTPIGVSFAALRRWAVNIALEQVLWDATDIPTGVWIPVLPSAAGIGISLALLSLGRPPEVWFSQVDPAADWPSRTKQLANRFTPLAVRAFGSRFPTPVHVTTADPTVALDWVQDALARAGRALLHAYPSSAVALATQAVERGISLEGLILRMGGEAVSTAKLKAVEAAGARTLQIYASTTEGVIAAACPYVDDESTHFLGHDHAIIERRRPRADGVEVGAFLLTTLGLDVTRVLLNAENDDYGALSVDDTPCPCALGQAGYRTRVEYVRGMSKVVAGGVTVPGEVFEQLVEQVLPAAHGGVATDYQFAEVEDAERSGVVLRVHPRLGHLDHDALAATVHAALAGADTGRLAAEVWGPAGQLRIERAVPVPAPSGKTLPFEPLPR